MGSAQSNSRSNSQSNSHASMLTSRTFSTKTVEDFDPSRYSGLWYEVGKQDMVWERDCSSAQAVYAWDSNQQVLLVENTCFDENGDKKRSRYGQARIANVKDPGKLLLKFTDGLPSYPGESPYWVYHTDYTNYAIVGGSSGRYLWLLSRAPTIPREDATEIMRYISSLGYDPNKLLVTPGSII